MEKLTVFYLDGCPYCRNARKAFGELAAEGRSAALRREREIKRLSHAQKISMTERQNSISAD